MIKSNLKQLLELRRMSIREFSRQADYRFETVRKFHNNDLTIIPIQLIEKSCLALKVTPSELFTIYEGEDDQNGS
ncbi:helix-turn-helix domain-containing protein [Jeotgalibacillus proteolyticus]|uniref:helix-turn-helix domain-containing protein n=1 Tax=Jeotgalibacillus proteolyticus TaxID=2082395 RepID=UPI003CED7E95